MGEGVLWLLLDLLIVKVIQFQSLLEHKQMFQFVIAFQRLFDLLFTLAHPHLLHDNGPVNELDPGKILLQRTKVL
jgi:hypothetical protein